MPAKSNRILVFWEIREKRKVFGRMAETDSTDIYPDGGSNPLKITLFLLLREQGCQVLFRISPFFKGEIFGLSGRKPPCPPLQKGG